MLDVERIEQLQDNLIKETDEGSILKIIDKIIEYKETDNSVENTLLVINRKLVTFKLLGVDDQSIREKSRKYFIYSIHEAFKSLIDLLETQKDVFEIRRLTGILSGNHYLSEDNYEEFGIYEAKTFKCYINGIYLPNLLEIMYWSEDLITVVSKITPYIVCNL